MMSQLKLKEEVHTQPDWFLQLCGASLQHNCSPHSR